MQHAEQVGAPRGVSEHARRGRWRIGIDHDPVVGARITAEITGSPFVPEWKMFKRDDYQRTSRWCGAAYVRIVEESAPRQRRGTKGGAPSPHARSDPSYRKVRPSGQRYPLLHAPSVALLLSRGTH